MQDFTSHTARYTALLVAPVALMLGSASAGAAPDPTPAPGPRLVVDRVAAVIEGDIVTLRELQAKAAPFMGQLQEIDDPIEREAKRQELLQKVLDIEISERIVNREILASKERLGVSDKDVDRAIEEVVRLNGLTRQQLQDTLYRQGISWSEYRGKLHQQIERARLIQFKVQGKVQVRDRDVKQRCMQRQSVGTTGERVCAAHLLLKVGPEATQDEQRVVHNRASQLQSELSAGADFAAYALKYSDDKSAPDGALGCFGKGEMVQPFEEASFGTKVGQVSAVVRTDFGYHVIKVLERKHAPAACEDEGSLTPFRNELFQEEMERQMNIWTEELRAKAFVEVRL